MSEYAGVRVELYAPDNEFGDDETFDELYKRKNAQIKGLHQLLDTAYGVITNVDGGTEHWDKDARYSAQSRAWYDGASQFMRAYRDAQTVTAMQREKAEPLADWEIVALASGSDETANGSNRTAADTSAMLDAYKQCRADAQALLTPLSPGSHWPAAVSSDWHASRAAWMRKWSV